MSARQKCVVVLAVLAAAGGLLLVTHGRGGAARAVAVDRRPGVVVALPTDATPSPAASPTPSPSLAPSADQAMATARAFLVAYATYRADDTPASLRARLRPYDTERLDGVLGQGAAGGAMPTAGGATVGQLVVAGLAPDGRLIVTAQVTAGGATRYVELYLASTAGGWRVDEVAL